MKKLFLLCLVALFSCVSSDEETKEVKVSFEENDVPISVEQLNRYYSWYVNPEESLFIGYNHTRHSLDFFGLEEKELIKSVKLDYEGPNGLQNPGRFVYYQDTFILNPRAYIGIVSADGEVMEKNFLDDYKASSQAEYLFVYGMHAVNHDELIYNPAEKTVILPVFNPKPRAEKEHYEGPILASLNLTETKMEILDVTYPEIFRGNDFYGRLDYPRAFQKGDSLIYNFANSSKIYYHNIRTKEEKIFDAQSQFVENIAPTLPRNAELKKESDHEWESNRFYALRYDPYKKLYYRVHKGKTENGGLFDYSNNYFMILDDQFKVLSEFKLDPLYEPKFAVTQQGVLFQMKDDLEKGENVWSYALMDISITEKK